MFKRPFFWLGLLLGGLASFGLRRWWLLPRPASLDPLLHLVSDAVVLCDGAGAVTDTNAAARALFGPDGAGLSRLTYPSGQPVPPGQLPVSRALRTGKATEGAGYQYLSAEGKTHILDIEARLAASGGVVVTARDRTEMGESQARAARTEGRDEVLRALCRRLSAAPDAEALAQALVESAHSLTGDLPDARVRLYLYDSDAKQLTRLASAPQERPRRPKSHRQAQPPTFPFDASSPLLWSLYVAHEPAVGTELGDEAVSPSYALPLVAGGVTLGHLSVACPDPDAFAASDLRDALGLLASVAALALAGPRQAVQTEHLAAQVEALRAVIQAVAKRTEPAELADLASREVRRVTRAEVCTLALGDANGLRLVGTAYQDALLFPDRHAPDDPALLGETAKAAVTKGRTVSRAGRANPCFEAGVWRAFAGQSGRHSVVSVPLAAGQGALTVYAMGEAPVPDAQVKFLETLAALVSAVLPEASPPAGRRDG